MRVCVYHCAVCSLNTDIVYLCLFFLSGFPASLAHSSNWHWKWVSLSLVQNLTMAPPGAGGGRGGRPCRRGRRNKRRGRRKRLGRRSWGWGRRRRWRRRRRCRRRWRRIRSAGQGEGVALTTDLREKKGDSVKWRLQSNVWFRLLHKSKA